jgi:amino-acid N-acetyltransferase
MQITGAHSTDLAQIKALLAANQLPSTDLTERHLNQFLILRDVDGAVVASVGLEHFSEGALLRSLVVAKRFQNAGLGRFLVLRAEHMAIDEGCVQLWLLTTTAQAFFLKQGYEIIERNVVPADVQLSAEFSLLCPTSAVRMTKQFHASWRTYRMLSGDRSMRGVLVQR